MSHLAHNLPNCKDLCLGLCQFTSDPSGLGQEQGMLGRSPEEVAKFLAKSAGLNKTMIGEYLGEREDFCLRVMHAFVDDLDFSNMEFDASIR